MTRKILILLVFCLGTFFLLWVATAAAAPGNTATTPPGPGGTAPTPVPIEFKLDNPFRFGNNLYDVVQALVNNLILPIGGVLCVLAFIFAGFRYVMAQGNSTKIADANRTLLYATIGTAVLLGSWVIANVIKNTIGQL